MTEPAHGSEIISIVDISSIVTGFTSRPDDSPCVRGRSTLSCFFD
jgi:hypothetical protein